MLKADLHIHTCYSVDCGMPLDRIVARCLQLGINCVAIADHHSIAGALKLQEIAPFRVIIGEEIRTPVGELMGLFLTEEVPRGLSVQETIARIKSQGGLVNIPHPFGHLPLGNKKLLTEEILSQVDLIEVFNSRVPFRNSAAKARELASKYKLPASAGSDAHTLSEIGRAYVEMPEFKGVEDFLRCLNQGKISGRRSSPLVHFASMRWRIKKGRHSC
jgi:hypothetical protein